MRQPDARTRWSIVAEPFVTPGEAAQIGERNNFAELLVQGGERPQFCHANQKGIIHTYNNKVTDMVAAALDKAGMARRRIILRGGGRVREEAMTLFRKSSDPLILISPSAMLGLSLDDDLGRWQAIVKLPYPYLGDPSVEHRKDNIPDWYEWQTAKDLIQTFGF